MPGQIARTTYSYPKRNQRKAIVKLLRRSQRPKKRVVPKSITRGQTDSTIFPRKGMSAKFVYSSIGDYSTPVSASYQIRMNSLYDVDITNVGHQPQYYDYLLGSSGPYGISNVKSAVLKVTVINTGTTGIWLTGGLWTSASQVAAASLDNFRDNGGPMKFIPSNGYSTEGSITLRIPNMSKYCGVDPNEDTLGAAYNANPGRQVYAFIGVFTTAGVACVSQYPINIELIQMAWLSNRSYDAQD